MTGKERRPPGDDHQQPVHSPIVLRAVIEFSAPFLVGQPKGDTADAVFVSDANGLRPFPVEPCRVLRSRFREMFFGG
jgi:hypothetical protein